MGPYDWHLSPVHIQWNVQCLPHSAVHTFVAAVMCSDFGWTRSSPSLYLKHNDEPNTHFLKSLGKTENKKTDRKLNCSFNECVNGREPHCHCCTSPQMIALCVGVWPLYSTLDKTSVSVHDACYNTQTNKVRWVCLFASCLSCSILCPIYFTEALIDLQTFRFSLRSSIQDVRGAILFYVMHLAAH